MTGGISGGRDEGGHAAGDAIVAAVGKEFVAMRVCAAIGGVDAIGVQTAGKQLPVCGGGEIDQSLAIGAAHDRGARAEHGGEFVQNLRAYFKTGRADAGSDRGQ